VVKVTVAMPVESVVEVAAEKPPFESLLVQVTTWPLVDTAFPLASANCAVIVTPLPAVGDVLDDVTKYLLAAPTTVVIVAVVPV
jgi:hypothetical protein